MQYKQNLWIWDERLKVGGGWSSSYEHFFCLFPNWTKCLGQLHCMQDIMAIFNFLDLNTNLFVSMYIIERILCNKSRSFLFEHFWKRKFWDLFFFKLPKFLKEKTPRFCFVCWEFAADERTEFSNKTRNNASSSLSNKLMSWGLVKCMYVYIVYNIEISRELYES